jgi:peroxiredoxin
VSWTAPGRGSRTGSVRGTLRLAGAVAATLTALAGLGAAVDPPKSLRLTRVSPADPAPAFSVATPDGGTLRLDELKGKVVFLNFWATWCEPCLEEMPAMERLSRAYRDRGLVVLALSADREGASVVRPFLKRHNLTFPVGLDADHSVARLYRVWALPSTFILDRTGARRFQAHGARNWDGKDSLAFFDALLKPGS